MRWYLDLWRDALLADDWFQRLLARLSILCTHFAVIMTLILIWAAFR